MTVNSLKATSVRKQIDQTFRKLANQWGMIMWESVWANAKTNKPEGVGTLKKNTKK